MGNLEKQVKVIAVPNRGLRTFTLRKTIKGMTILKYRTTPMTKYEFENKLFYTSEDWKRFLLQTTNYYSID